MRSSQVCILMCLACSLWCAICTAQPERIYLFPGQGSDERIFQGLHFDSTRYEVIAIDYPRPVRGESMSTYAHRLKQQMDTTRPYTFIGVSLGGMISQELCRELDPEQVIVISSITERQELPPFYRSQRWLPLYRLIPAGIIKLGSRIAQPIFEPDRKAFAPLFRSMLRDKDARFIKRAIGMIASWQPPEHCNKVIHIHGDDDHTLPIRRSGAEHVIIGGSHMMARTCTNMLQPILDRYLSE